MAYTVYKHVNRINGKVYIGITKQSPEKRWGTDGVNYSSSPHFYAAIKKYGWDNFDHLIIITGLSKEQACSKEKELISSYNSNDRNYGYNQTSGGEDGLMSSDSKMKLSRSMMGNKNGLNHPCSEEKRKKISAAQKGRKLSSEHREKLSIAAKKRHVPCSEEKKKQLSNNYPNKKPVYCVELDIVYDSVHECARQLELHATAISKVCKGLKHTTGGYHFQYYNDAINA